MLSIECKWLDMHWQLGIVTGHITYMYRQCFCYSQWLLIWKARRMLIAFLHDCRVSICKMHRLPGIRYGHYPGSLQTMVRGIQCARKEIVVNVVSRASLWTVGLISQEQGSRIYMCCPCGWVVHFVGKVIPSKQTVIYWKPDKLWYPLTR